ncbi:MAG: hypothetical protein KGI69_01000 [Patescibacteria group bacterium]|nr:hypothetical protein [Patescibacteria group bacterium]
MNEKQRKAVNARIKKDKEQFIQILEKNPVIQIACERSGVSKATFYRWREADKDFATAVDKAMSEGKSLISDIAISQLISAIKDKNLGAIKFWLEKHHPDYSNKLQVTATVEQEYVLSPEQEALVRRALTLVTLPTSNLNHHGD